MKFKSVTSNPRVTSSNLRVMSTSLRPESSNLWATISDLWATSSNPQVTSLNTRVTSSNPRFQESFNQWKLMNNCNFPYFLRSKFDMSRGKSVSGSNDNIVFYFSTRYFYDYGFSTMWVNINFKIRDLHSNIVFTYIPTFEKVKKKKK